MQATTNRIGCRYCEWQTLRFCGKKHGEAALRLHVIENHKEAYLQTQGLEALPEDSPWFFDDDTRGPQAL